MYFLISQRFIKPSCSVAVVRLSPVLVWFYVVRYFGSEN